jgi:uncharacterized membrane protein
MTSRIAGGTKPHNIECVFLLAAVPVLAGLLIAAVGCLGLRERLPRNRYFGVRTTASLRDDQTFRLANKIAGLPALVGGLVGILSGVAAFLMPGTGGLVLAVLIGLAGLLAITVGGGVLGHRAALALPQPKPPVPAGCGGCACGNCFRTSVGTDVAGVGGE